MNSLETQIGGNHYKKYKIQPIEFIVAHDIPFIVANPFKYLCRFRDKNGGEDLNKAIHYIQIMIDLNYINPRPIKYEDIYTFTDQLDCQVDIKFSIISLLTCNDALTLDSIIETLEKYKKIYYPKIEIYDKN